MLSEIKLAEVLRTMEQLSPLGEPVPFKMVAIAASRRDPASSGRIITFTEAISARLLRHLDPNAPLAHIREYTPKLQKKVPSKQLRNSIRRIYRLQDHQFRNVHIRLIMSFNDRPVVP